MTPNISLYTEWSDEYSNRRYLQRTPLNDLEQREIDLIRNIVTIDLDGRAAVYAGERFRRRLAHVLAEYKLRGVAAPASHAGDAYPSSKRAAELWKTITLPRGTYLLKFGNLRWMDATFTSGRIRIANAKSYDDSSLSLAIRDREMEFSQEYPTATLSLPMPGGTRVPIDTVGNLRRIASTTTDFYIASFGLQYDYRLFDDFSRDCTLTYDACIVIRDPKRFEDQMRREVERTLTGWDFYATPVKYLDPYDRVPYSQQIDVFFSKHFRYAYQEEYRMAWIPPMPLAALTPIYIEMGPLIDYCELLIA
jgi:hypothetical protein